MTKGQLCAELTEQSRDYVLGGLKVARMFGVDTNQIVHMYVTFRRYSSKSQRANICTIWVQYATDEGLHFVKEVYGFGDDYKDQAKAILAGEGIEYDIISYSEIAVEKKKDLWA